MRAFELFKESIDFSVSELKPYGDGSRQAWHPVGGMEEVDCWACDGNGWEDFGHGDGKEDCRVCDATGKREEFVGPVPEFNVANANGYEIQRMMGLEPDYTGAIEPEDVPTILRRLIKLKNMGSEQHTRDSSREQGPARATKDADGQSRISRGPTMVDFGRSQGQVNRYLDDMIKMLKYASDNGYGISWG